MLGVVAAVEQALDALAAGDAVDVDATVSRLRQRIDEVRTETARRRGPGGRHRRPPRPRHRQPHPPDRPDPDAWAEAVARWEAVGDPWWVAVATLREADAAAPPATRPAPPTRCRPPTGWPSTSAPRAWPPRPKRSHDAPGSASKHPPAWRSTSSSIERLGLTAREAEVLALVAAGQTNRQIGEQLFVSEKTASVHVSNILRKLGVTSRVDAAAVAQRLGVA